MGIVFSNINSGHFKVLFQYELNCFRESCSAMDDEGNVNQGEQSPRDEEAPVEPQ